jgi:deaminated glutathione amidase
MQHRVACVQMTSSTDVRENLESAKQYIEEAAATGARLVVLPEMFAIMDSDALSKVKVAEQSGHGLIQDFLREIAIREKIWLVGGTIPLITKDNPEKIRAATLVYDDAGELKARYDKIHLFDVQLRNTSENYRESKTTEPGDKVVVLDTPIGRVGLAVCYDVRFPELFRHMQAQGAEIIILPTAFTYTTGAVHWDVLVRARAIENLTYLIAACQSGTHANGRRTYGHSMIVNPWGIVSACLPAGNGVLSADIDLDYVRKLREEFPVLLHKKL